MQRIGILGGTFDPVHIGHLACAEFARDACRFDEVVFMVAGSPHFKQGVEMAPAQARLEMVKRAVRGNAFFRASDAEIERPGITYTFETLECFRREHPGSELSFILGTDSLLTLHDWKQASRIADLARIVCVSRPGYQADQVVLDRLVSMGFTVKILEAPLLDVSSTEVRMRIRHHATVRYLVPDAVRSYIEEEGLYGDGEEGHGRI